MDAAALLETGKRIYEIATYAYFVSFLVYGYHAFFNRSKTVGYIGLGMLSVTWIIHTAFMVNRALFYYEQHGGFLLPATNMFEAISYMAWMITLLYIIAELRLFKTGRFGVFALLLPFALMAYNARAMMVEPGAADPRDLFPSLKSYWLWIHVSCMFISYAIFALAAVFAVLYILRAHGITFGKMKELLNLGWLDGMSNRLTLLGFPVLTLGVFLGAVWADSAWGRYWGWDPKEVWALITWLIYLAYFHFRVQQGWVGYRSALLNALGFIMVLITFKGVNLLNDIFNLNSIHAYTSGQIPLGDQILLGVLFVSAVALIVMQFLPLPDETELNEFLAGKSEEDDAPEGKPVTVGDKEASARG